MKRWTTRDLVTLAVFGALWGVAEMSLGAMLHALRLPFAGAGLSAIGMIIALTGYSFVPRRGAVLIIGLVSALLKAFSIGSEVLSPMVAIAAEVLLAELGLILAGGRPSRAAMMLAGALGVLWALVHPFLTMGILGGRGMLAVYQRVAQGGAKLLGLGSKGTPMVVIILIALHLALGTVAGAAAWGLARQLARRLQPRAA